MNRKVEKITGIISQIANWGVPGERYKEAYKKLRKLTSEVWNEFHIELLSELERIEDYGMREDYQKLWYDALGFPPLIPRTYNLEGKPTSLSYGFIPSDFNNIGFHDSVIKNIVYEEKLIFDLDLLEFWEQDGNWYQNEYDAKLKFYNVGAILHREFNDKNRNFKYINFDVSKVSGNMIMGFTEIPSINYVFRYLEIDPKYYFREKRMFLLSLTMGSDDEVIIFADGWEIDKNKKNL